MEIKNLTIRALEFERRGDYKKCEEYCNRILDLDPTNREIRALEKRLPTYSAGPNVTIIYKSVHDYKYKLRVSLDGRNWEILNHGETLSLTLPVGGYQIIFSGTKRYLYNLSVFDEDEKITVIYDAQRWKNEIEEIHK